jgi:hypothetical protein
LFIVTNIKKTVKLGRWAGVARSPPLLVGALDKGGFGVIFLGSRGKLSGGMDAACYNKFGGKKTLLFLMFST